jgi:hypothetical protein
MNSDERRLLDDLIRRLGDAPRGPRDPDAEAMIADALRRIPDAPYLLAQSLILHEQALAASARRIAELERDASAARGTGQGGFLSGAALGPWGSRQTPANSAGYQQPPQQSPNTQYQQPAYQPASVQPGLLGGGGGFLRGAAATALGFAGGTLLADGLLGMLGHHGAMLGGLGVPSASTEINETVNNYYGGAPDDRYANDPAADHPGADDPGVQDASYDQDDGGWADDGSSFDDV